VSHVPWPHSHFTPPKHVEHSLPARHSFGSIAVLQSELSINTCVAVKGSKKDVKGRFRRRLG
jgi:hypothetical protein